MKNKMNTAHKTAFIGFGNMARALINGAILANQLQNDHIVVSSPSLNNGTQSTPLPIAKNNREAARQAEIIFLCTKPNIIPSICTEIADVIAGKNSKPLIVSIAAGIPTSTIEKHLHCNDIPIIRAMPNTPVSVGLGVIGLYANPFVTLQQRTKVSAILESTGVLVQMNNELDLDKLTAISGSGPAYFLLMEEMLVNAAKKLGLTDEVANTLVQQTMLGTSVLASKSPLRFEALRAQVTSKGGTTAAAIDHFIEGGIEPLVNGAVLAAYHRAIELSTTS